MYAWPNSWTMHTAKMKIKYRCCVLFNSLHKEDETSMISGCDESSDFIHCAYTSRDVNLSSKVVLVRKMSNCVRWAAFSSVVTFLWVVWIYKGA